LNREDVKAVVQKALFKMKLAEKSQQDKDRNAFAVVLAREAAGKPDFRMGAAGRRERASTGLLVVGGDVLSLIPTFLSWEKVELQREWQAPGGECVWSCHISPCSSMVLTASGNNSNRSDLHLWDTASGLLKSTPKGHTSCCRFFPDGTTVVSASRDHTLKVWDVASGSLVRTLAGHTDVVYCVDVPLDNARILSGSEDGTWKLWNTRTGEILHTEHVGGYASCCSFSPNGSHFLVICDSKLMLHDSTTFQLQHTFAGHTNCVTSCSFTPDGTTVLSGSDDCTMKLWSTATGQCLRTFYGHTSLVNSCFFSPSGHEIFSAADDGNLVIRTTGTGELKWVLDVDVGSLFSVSSSGTYFVTGHGNGTVKMWRVRARWGAQ
jgi:WD40 repeat protein